MAKKRKATKAVKSSWATGELNLLKKTFSATPTAQIAKKLGRGLDAVKKKASRMGLRKSKSYMKKIGRA